MEGSKKKFQPATNLPTQPPVQHSDPGTPLQGGEIDSQQSTNH